MASPRRADDCGGVTIGRLAGDTDEDGQCEEEGAMLPATDAARGGRRDASRSAGVAEASSRAKRCKVVCLVLGACVAGFCAGWAGNDALDASLSPVTRQFLASLRVCGACDNFRRLGEPHDGGYLTCMDGWTPGRVKAALSMGVEEHDKWSLDMSALLGPGAAIHQFDCTVPRGQACPGCEFHKVCMAPEGDTAKPNFWSLSQVLQNTGLAQAPNRSIVMKMDVENAEWRILATETPAVLSKFQQVLLEFHRLTDTAKHGLYAQAVQTMLNAGFRVVHIHGNNYQKTYYLLWGRYRVPKVLEVTFVADARPIQCQADQALHHLDADNNPKGWLLPMAHLPMA